MPIRAALSAAIFAVLALPAAAQDAATDSPADLDRVTVSASTSRIPESEAALPNTITIIDQAQLQQQLAVTQDLSQVLANLIPAFAPSRQKLTSFGESLRGRQPLYMVDGVPQSTPLRDGSRDAHTIDPAMIERIEVIHGANALQGLGASGGIINIITRHAPRKDGTTFHDIRVGFSNALPDESDAAGYRASYLLGTRRGALDFVGGASFTRDGLHHDAEGRALAVNGVQGDLMDSQGGNLFAKAGWSIDAQRRLQLTANRYELQGDGDYETVDGDFELGIPATSVPGRQRGEPPRNLSTSLTMDYTDRDIVGGSLQAQLYWVDFEALYGGSTWGDFYGNDPVSDWFDQSENASEKVGGKFTWSRGDIGGMPLRMTLGLDVQRDTTRQRLVVSDLDWVPETRYSSVSPLLQAEYWPTDTLMLTAGLRNERGKLEVDDFTTLPVYNGGQLVRGGSPETSETLPNFGAVWHITGALKAYASYSEGYTVADIGRVLRGISVPDRNVIDLVDLSPVVADNREVGLDYEDARWNAHLAAYWSDSELGSRLAFDPLTETYNVAREPTEINGFEGNVAFRFSENGRVGLGYAATEGRYDSDLDGHLDTDLQGINVSPDRAVAFWEQTWTPAVSTRLQGSRAEDREFDRRGNIVARFEGYTTLDLQARVALPVGTLNLGVENLLGRQYITYYSQTTPSDDDYVAGRGRVFSASWSHRF